MKKIKRENIGEHLFDHQLAMIGKTRVDLVDDDKWHFHFTMTRAQYIEFRDYAISLMMKTFRCNKNKAISNFEWYWQQFRVRIRN